LPLHVTGEAPLPFRIPPESIDLGVISLKPPKLRLT
jgi:hypothetical protein